MGLFNKHKEKAARPDLVNTQPSNPTNQQTPHQPRPNVSFNDSTYYTNSNASNASSEEARINQAPPQNQQARPGTTVTTTTTTTTSKCTLPVKYFSDLRQQQRRCLLMALRIRILTLTILPEIHRRKLRRQL